jgi:hypothetical protein
MRPFHHGLIESMSPLRSLRFFARFAFSLIANAARTLAVVPSLKINRKERKENAKGANALEIPIGSGESHDETGLRRVILFARWYKSINRPSVISANLATTTAGLSTWTPSPPMVKT